MTIRKTELREFIEGKAQRRKDELRKAVYAAVEEAIKPIILLAYEGAAIVEAQAERLHESLIKLQEQYKRFEKSWDISKMIRDLNSDIIGLRTDIVRQQAIAVVYNLLDRGTDGFMKEIEDTVAAISESHAKPIAEYKDLVKLTDELTTIIDSSHNGDKAYKRLQELGVDLSDFKGGSNNLPAVIKLSVDPCLINGNCG